MKNELRNCPDCSVKPGEIHLDNCDVERCSACGFQRLSCNCENSNSNDKQFSRWTGIWPGELESTYLGLDLNDFYKQGYNKIFFIKP